MWKRIEPTKITKVGWRTIVTKTFSAPEHEDDTFDTINPENYKAAAVIALTTENKVVIARQFRFGPEKIFYELPGGYVESKEDAIDAVKRELLEETGYAPGNIESIGICYKDGWSNVQHEFFIAFECKKAAEPMPDKNEIILVELISISQLFQNARDAKMTDVEAVFLAYDRLKALEG